MHAEGRRARDAAEELGVSEADLVASTCADPSAGVFSVPMSIDNAAALYRSVSELGIVKTQTRNASVVLEVVGAFPAARIEPALRAWGSCFAVRETSKRAQRTSLQVFDTDGAAIVKLFMLRESDEAAFERLVRGRRIDAACTPVTRAGSTPPKPPESGEKASDARTASLARVLRKLSAERSAITVSVSNRGVTHAHEMTVRRLGTKNDWLSVLDRNAKVLLHRSAIATVCPSSDGRLVVELRTGEHRDAVLRGISVGAVAGHGG